MTDPTLAAQIEALYGNVTWTHLAADQCGEDWRLHDFPPVHGDPSRPEIAEWITSNLDQYEANLVALLFNNLPAIVTALRQAEAAPGVVEAAARVIDPGAWKQRDRYIEITNGIGRKPDDEVNRKIFVESAERRKDTVVADSIAKATTVLALARQHGAREGMVLVPSRITQAMEDAWRNSPGLSCAVAYQAMLEAAELPGTSTGIPVDLPAAPATDVGEKA